MGRVHGFDCTHGVAFYTRDLNQAGDRVAGHAEVMLHGNLGRNQDLFHAAPHGFGECRGGHRRRHPDFRLASTRGG